MLGIRHLSFRAKLVLMCAALGIACAVPALAQFCMWCWAVTECGDGYNYLILGECGNHTYFALNCCEVSPDCLSQPGYGYCDAFGSHDAECRYYDKCYDLWRGQFWGYYDTCG